MNSFVTLEQDPDQFQQLWTRYLQTHPASFRYTAINRKYLSAYGNPVEELSFVLKDGDGPRGICYLPVESTAEGHQFTIGNSFIPGPLAANPAAFDLMLEEIGRLAEIHQAGKIAFYHEALDAGPPGVSLFRQAGYLECPTTDAVVDLRAGVDSLKLRENHKRSIKKLERDPAWQIRFFDHTTADRSIHEQYRELHHLCSGRVTRKQETFDLQYEMLCAGEALLVGLEHAGRFAAFCYFFHHQKSAAYASGADDPGLAGEPLYHTLIWHALREYTTRGFEYLVLGQPFGFSSVPGFMDYYDDKQLRISHFKLGFRPEPRLVPRAVKYRNPSLLLKDIEIFRGKAEALNHEIL